MTREEIEACRRVDHELSRDEREALCDQALLLTQGLVIYLRDIAHGDPCQVLVAADGMPVARVLDLLLHVNAASHFYDLKILITDPESISDPGVRLTMVENVAHLRALGVRVETTRRMS